MTSMTSYLISPNSVPQLSSVNMYEIEMDPLSAMMKSDMCQAFH